jgi:hypothetical protein
MEEPLIRITVDMFSGRPNPVIEFRGDEIAELLDRMAPGPRVDRRELGLPPMPTLGYRGLTVDLEGIPDSPLPNRFRVAAGAALGPDFAYRLADETLEDFICGSVPEDLMAEEELLRFRGVLDYWFEREPPEIVWPVEIGCPCAPPYEPAWWNHPLRKDDNNCYNYGTNYRTDTFAQPGKAANVQGFPFTCPIVTAAAVADGLIDSPQHGNKCPDEGHLVALVRYSGDYHWYRLGRNGFWSHKGGDGPATNLDNSGNLIADPRTADRGPYVDFCTFMIVMHGHIKIE